MGYDDFFKRSNSYFQDGFKSGLPREVYDLEQEDMYSSKDIFFAFMPDDEEGYPANCFLYHGIRFENQLQKLENILKEQKLLAGKYVNGYLNYSDNANKGEYISLMEYMGGIGVEFDKFIGTNLSLLILPDCDAYLTKYVDYNTWLEIKDKKTKNLYSYMPGEYLCKDFIPLNLIRAVGVPYRQLTINNGKDYADNILLGVKDLLDKYEVNLAIVDPGSLNKILVDKKTPKQIK